MIIGVPKEIKPQENRIGAVPAMVLELVEAGNTVLVERGGGLGAGISDEEYTAVGGIQFASKISITMGESTWLLEMPRIEMGVVQESDFSQDR